MLSTDTPVTIQIPAQAEQGWELLDELDSVITSLGQALGECNTARRDLTVAEEALAVLEAEIILSVSGANAETRRAAVTIQMAQSPEYQLAQSQAREAQDRVREADREVTVLKEKARLIHAALRLFVHDQR